MHGNVWELCLDWYGDYPKGDVTDPKGPETGTGRVNRGGSWFVEPHLIRSAFRSGDVPSGRNANLGFRVSMTVKTIKQQ